MSSENRTFENTASIALHTFSLGLSIAALSVALAESGGGSQGPSGQQGVSGIQGASGASGQQGVSGEQGVSGASGQQGVSGASGQQGVSGASGQQGVSGASGQQGVSGASGQQGVSGVSGQQGVTGASGTSVSLTPLTATNDATIALSQGAVIPGATLTLTSGIMYQCVFSASIGSVSAGGDISLLVYMRQNGSYISGSSRQIQFNQSASISASSNMMSHAYVTASGGGALDMFVQQITAGAWSVGSFVLSALPLS